MFARDGINISIEQIEKELEDMAKNGLVELTYEE